MRAASALAVITTIALITTGCAPCGNAEARDNVPRDVTVLKKDLSPLRNAFNAHTDRWRAFALVSPTCSERSLGAEAVEKEIVQRYAADRVETIVVWIPMLETDNEKAARESATIFPVKRAIQFYDLEQRVGLAYSRGTFVGFVNRARKSLPKGHPLEDKLNDRSEPERPQWDLYMLYAPGVRWDAKNEEPPIPTHWIRHCGRMDGGKSPYWRDTPESGPQEGSLFEAMRTMADQAIGAIKR